MAQFSLYLCNQFGAFPLMGEGKSGDSTAELTDQAEQREIDLYPELVAFSKEPDAIRAAALPRHGPPEEAREQPAVPLVPGLPPRAPSLPEAASGNGKRDGAPESPVQILGSTCSECGNQFPSGELFCPTCGAFTE
jgi:hypothetical protein